MNEFSPEVIELYNKVVPREVREEIKIMKSLQKVKQRQSQMRTYAKNKEHYKQYAKGYYENNKEKFKAYSEKYCREHREEITLNKEFIERNIKNK